MGNIHETTRACDKDSTRHKMVHAISEIFFFKYFRKFPMLQTSWIINSLKILWYWYVGLEILRRHIWSDTILNNVSS